jgi:hypothetical protein
MILREEMQILGSIIILAYFALLYNPSRARDGSGNHG